MSTVQEIEQAIEKLTPEELQELYAWLEYKHLPQTQVMSVAEQGLGMFSSPEDAKLLDEVVEMAYAERKRPAQ
jgi:hypothetical protein